MPEDWRLAARPVATAARNVREEPMSQSNSYQKLMEECERLRTEITQSQTYRTHLMGEIRNLENTLTPRVARLRNIMETIDMMDRVAGLLATTTQNQTALARGQLPPGVIQLTGDRGTAEGTRQAEANDNEGDQMVPRRQGPANLEPVNLERPTAARPPGQGDGGERNPTVLDSSLVARLRRRFRERQRVQEESVRLQEEERREHLRDRESWREEMQQQLEEGELDDSDSGSDGWQ